MLESVVREFMVIFVILLLGVWFIKMSFYGDISGAKEFSAIKQTRWKRTTTTSCWKDIDLGETIYYCGLQTSLASHWSL